MQTIAKKATCHAKAAQKAMTKILGEMKSTTFKPFQFPTSNKTVQFNKKTVMSDPDSLETSPKQLVQNSKALST